MTAPNALQSPPRQLNLRLPRFLRNTRVISAISQIVFVFLFVSLISVLWSNINNTLASRNLTPGFDFLNTRAGFGIAESPSWYSAESTYGQAFSVGIINTLRIVSVGLVSATFIGILLGIALLSRNWLISTISKGYVEILRNTPLLVQLFFWYFVIILGLPTADIRLPAEGILVLSLRLPAYLLTGLAVGIWQGRTGRQGALSGLVLASVVLELVLAVLGYNDVIVLLAGALGIAGVLWGWRQHQWMLLGGALAWVIQAVAVLLSRLLPNGGVWWTEVQPAVYISKQAFVLPEFLGTNNFTPWLIAVLMAVVLAILVYRWLAQRQAQTGQPNSRDLIALGIVVGVAALAWVILGAQPAKSEISINGTMMSVEDARANGEITVLAQEAEISSLPIVAGLPQKPRFRFTVGSVISPEYIALLLGLVVYTSAFIGEIVRAGIQAVPYGQLEASRAMGLSGAQTLRLVILPQALRVIIPPLGNQYLNLSKNSSLAAAVAFGDTYQIGQTIMNQSGQSVTGFTMILLTYLTMSLLISLFMNIINRRFQIVSR